MTIVGYYRENTRTETGTQFLIQDVLVVHYYLSWCKERGDVADVAEYDL